MLQTTEETELTMPSDFRWHSFLVSAGYLPDTQVWAKVPSQEISDMLLAGLKEIEKEEKKETKLKKKK